MPSLENKVVTHITLSADASIHNRPPYVYAKQYDTNSRYLVVRIVDSNGDIAVKGTSLLNATKPDGKHSYIEGTANADGTVTFGFTKNLLAAEGKISCDISFFDSTGESQAMLTTSTFYILVDESNYNADAIKSEDEFLNVSDALAQMADCRDKAQQAAEEAKDAADSIVSPVITVSDIEGGHRVTVKDADGVKTFDILDGANGGVGIEKTSSNGLIDTYTITFTDDTISTFAVTNGRNGEDGIDGTSVTHSWDGTVLTVTSASGTSSADLKGEPGEQGQRGEDTVYVLAEGESLDDVPDSYNVVVAPHSEDGADGEAGSDRVGILSIEKTATSSDGLVDTYTIKLTNGVTSTFTVTNGRDGQDGTPGVSGADGVGISSITKTSATGLVDTYTITLTNGATSTFTVTNGRDGEDGADGVGIVSIDKISTSSDGLVDTYAITLTNGASYAFDVKHGETTIIDNTGESLNIDEVVELVLARLPSSEEEKF